MTQRFLLSTTRTVIAAVSCCLAAATWAQTGAYPSKPIRVVVPYAPGGPVDRMMRNLSPQLGAALGQPIVIENRGGGGGIIGMDIVAKATPDGYTLLAIAAGAMVVTPAIVKSMPFNVEKDLLPITQVTAAPSMIVAHPKLGVRSFNDLVAYAKANPGKVFFGSAGNGTMPHLAGELFKRENGVDIVHVPYKGSGPALTDLLAGTVQVMFSEIPTVQPHVAAGKLVGLAVSSPRRVDSVANVPITAESGHPNFLVSNWYGLLAPGGTPRAVVQRVHEAVITAVKNPDLVARLTKEGGVIVASTPEAFAGFIRSEAAKWGTLAKTVGVTVD
jgi:tripartite-type tricarboxylate transporter receptor subunit TctC